MRIDPSGYGDRNERIMSFVCDEVFFTIFNEYELKYVFSVWAYKHEDDTFTMHWSYNGIGDVGMTEPIYVENPMTAFANSRPIIDKIIKAINDSGIV